VHDRIKAALVVGAVTAAALLSACSRDDGPRTGATDDAAEGRTNDPVPGDRCDWPMFGQSPARTFSYPKDCPTSLSPETVATLGQAWFFNTDDVVTASPAVAGGTVYVGDWSGVFYAIDAETGDERWRYRTEVHPTVYSGQIVSSAAVAEVDGTSRVFVGAGKSVLALDADTGEQAWSFDLADLDRAGNHEPGDDIEDVQRPTEVQSSPVVVDGAVIVGFDAHNRPGFRAGLVALDAESGDLLWDFDPDGGEPPSGCAGVWSSPAVDLELGLVFAGSANCTSAPEGWGEFTEAIFAVHLETGAPAWSHQPHEPNRNDLDFAGAPNLFTVDGRDVVGLGNKDGRYRVVDRASGEPVWEALGKEPDFDEGSNFSFGGFIGATAVDRGIVAGGTAGTGPTACPCLHAFDTATGELLWQAPEPQPIYGASATAGGVLFAGGTDFTLRGFDLATGEVLWSRAMPGVVAGGVAVVGDDVYAVVGIREPGTDVTAQSAGVSRFTLDPDAIDEPDEPTDETAVDHEGPLSLGTTGQRCVDEPCDLRFNVPAPPEGLEPSGTLVITTDPFSLRMEVSGLGDPAQWVAPNAPDGHLGADAFVLAISVSDEQPVGSVLCTFEPTAHDTLLCEADTIGLLAPQYNRLTILALPEDAPFPSVAEGIARLVFTRAFDEALVLVDPSPPAGS
jgi:polyvinyl alcohol dehydrogenase (cytochrome)